MKLTAMHPKELSIFFYNKAGNMENYKISVIVPLYNCEEYIGNTLDSLINQDFDSYEIIVVDDGSTDGGYKIAEEKLNNSSCNYQLIHQENQGVSVARNTALDAASGDYLAFVDADDDVTSNFLSCLYNGKTDFSLTQYVKKYPDRVTQASSFKKDYISTEEFIKMELNMELTFNMFQGLYKREIIEKNNLRFTPGTVYGEDTEFALKAFTYGKDIALNNDVTYFYTQRDDSAIRTTEYRRFDIVEIYENYSEFLKKQGRSDLSDLVVTSRIPKAIFGNMNYFFYNDYDFDEVLSKMNELDLLTKLSKFKGDKKFELKIKLFLLSPKTYYKMWKKFKNNID